MTKKPIRSGRQEPEFEPDAWQRFERAVSVVAKSPPQPKKHTVKITKKKQRKKRT